MSILVNDKTRVVVQGITGKTGQFHTRQCLEYGTKIVAGVTPGKGGMDFEGVPIYNGVAQAVREQGADASLVFVPPALAADACMEAVEAGIKVLVLITEGIPTLDMLKLVRYARLKGCSLIGPNCPGIITPGECKIGIMPGQIHRPGNVGVISRSGTLTYEAVAQLSALQIGQSTCIGIGGDPVVGMNFVDCLELFNADPNTQAVVLIGEIGGSAEEEAAAYISQNFDRPVVSFIAGLTAPEGKRMGHAGAIISGGKGTAEEKLGALAAAGVTVVRDPSAIGHATAEVIRR
ncbi:MAG: succinate--CoA ligase subunit alpha [Candidatus Alcyoniella australis]|nr:succinate--CoA ligase subunit alpha [Candidatus Alcyoniella australis]